MNEAYVFQNNNGIQIFVYWALNKDDAIRMFKSSVTNFDKWQYVGKKVAKEV